MNIYMIHTQASRNNLLKGMLAFAGSSISIVPVNVHGRFKLHGVRVGDSWGSIGVHWVSSGFRLWFQG